MSSTEDGLGGGSLHKVSPFLLESCVRNSIEKSFETELTSLVVLEFKRSRMVTVIKCLQPGCMGHPIERDYSELNPSKIITVVSAWDWTPYMGRVYPYPAIPIRPGRRERIPPELLNHKPIIPLWEAWKLKKERMAEP